MTRKSLTLVAGIVSMLSAVGQAATVTWQGDVNGNWSEAGNWDTGALPGASDDVVIPSTGVTNEPNLDVNATINSLQVQTGRTLTFGGFKLAIDDGIIDIDSSGTVDLANGTSELELQAGSVTHIFDGRLLLSLDGAHVDVRQSQTWSGAGSVRGSYSSTPVRIQIASAQTLTNTMGTNGFVGAMKIEKDPVSGASAAAFANQGFVEAKGGLFELASTVDLSDSSGANRWRSASDIGSELKFSKAATGLSGGMVNNLKFTIAQNITTTGQFTFGCSAQIVVSSSMTYGYGSYSGTCSNPGSGSGPYTLSAGTYNCSCP